MNAAPMSSARLRRVEKVLSDGRPHTTLEIIQRASCCAVSAIVSELRQHGKRILCKRVGDKWYYVMLGVKKK